MSNKLINSVKSVFNDALITKFSVLLNETQGNVQKAVQGTIPMILTEILHEAGTVDGVANIENLSKQAAGNDFFGQIHELSVSSGSLVTGSVLLKKGSDFTRGLLADRKDAVIKEISRYSGTSSASASFITGVVTFASLDSIGRQITAGSLDAQGLTLWLDTQRESIMHAIPMGLEVKGPLGIHRYPREKAVRTRRNTVLTVGLGVVVLLAVILLVIFWPRKHTDVAIAPNSTDTLAVATTVKDTVAVETIHITLPNGRVIDVRQGGTEDQLVSFLSDHTAKLNKRTGDWFNFTKVGFASNSASLLLESEGQLKNIAAILTAFPKAKFKIGGYSDNTGDSTDNVRLSQQRADNICAKLKDLNANPSQLKGAKGYGPNYPVGDNGTEAGRNLNRRMSIDVVAK